MSAASVSASHIKNTSPLRYPGGKTRACKLLLELVKNNFDTTQFDCVLSPFFGGGSFEFKLQEELGWSVKANDGFAPLICFWRAAKNNNAELVDRVRAIYATVSKEQLQALRSALTTQSDVDQAASVFAINRCSFSGATLSGGFSDGAIRGRFTPSSIQRLANLNLSQVDFWNQDFEVFLKEQWQHNTFVFLDPPYYLEKGSKLYGTSGDMHQTFDHSKLSVLLKGKKGWLMTYNNCEWVRNAYSDCLILDAEWAYGMNKSKKSSEVVIIPRSAHSPHP